MKPWLSVLALIGVLLISGCTGGTPRAETPETVVDFGDVPVVTDMKQVQRKRFEIRNTGDADLKLRNIRVQLVEGC